MSPYSQKGSQHRRRGTVCKGTWLDFHGSISQKCLEWLRRLLSSSAEPNMICSSAMGSKSTTVMRSIYCCFVCFLVAIFVLTYITFYSGNESTTYPTVKPGEANLNHIKRQGKEHLKMLSTAGWLLEDPKKQLTTHEVLSLLIITVVLQKLGMGYLLKQL